MMEIHTSKESRFIIKSNDIIDQSYTKDQLTKHFDGIIKSLDISGSNISSKFTHSLFILTRDKKVILLKRKNSFEYTYIVNNIKLYKKLKKKNVNVGKTKNNILTMYDNISDSERKELLNRYKNIIYDIMNTTEGEYLSSRFKRIKCNGYIYNDEVDKFRNFNMKDVMVKYKQDPTIYMLPGGFIKKKELYHKGLWRELNEEFGKSLTNLNIELEFNKTEQYIVLIYDKMFNKLYVCVVNFACINVHSTKISTLFKPNGEARHLYMYPLENNNTNPFEFICDVQSFISSQYEKVFL